MHVKAKYGGRGKTLETHPMKYILIFTRSVLLTAVSVSLLDGVDDAAGAKVADVTGWASILVPDGDDLRVDPTAPPVV